MGQQTDRVRRGPLLYLAVGGLAGAAAAVPLVAAIPITADPNPIGYVLALLGVPAGGFAYRWRSRHWPIDQTVRSRQTWASLTALLFPGAIAFSTGMRAEGFGMTCVGLAVSSSVIIGLLVAGRRRGPKEP